MSLLLLEVQRSAWTSLSAGLALTSLADVGRHVAADRLGLADSRFARANRLASGTESVWLLLLVGTLFAAVVAALGLLAGSWLTPGVLPWLLAGALALAAAAAVSAAASWVLERRTRSLLRALRSLEELPRLAGFAAPLVVRDALPAALFAGAASSGFVELVGRPWTVDGVEDTLATGSQLSVAQVLDVSRVLAATQA